MDPSSEIGAVAVRVSALDSDGTPDFGNPVGATMLCGGISSLAYDFDTQEGKEIYEEDAQGNACVNMKRSDRLKRVTFTLTLCRTDMRMESLLLGPLASLLVGAGSVPTGLLYKAGSGCGTPVVNNGVAIELWNERIDCNEPDADYPYTRYVIPRAFVRPGAGTLNEATRPHVYVGYGTVNNNFDDGPFGDLDEAVGAQDWPLGKFAETYVPACPPDGFFAIPGSAS